MTRFVWTQVIDGDSLRHVLLEDDTPVARVWIEAGACPWHVRFLDDAPQDAARQLCRAGLAETMRAVEAWRRQRVDQ